MNVILVANRPVVNLYLLPSAEVEVVSQAIYGAVVDVVANAGEWLRVRTGDRYEGWALLVDFLPLVQEPGGLSVRVIQLSANVYAEPDVKKRAALLQLPWEARLEVRVPAAGDFDAEEWVPVWLLDGREAFVLRGDVSEEAALTLEEMLKLAHRFLGITYTWGGASSCGFDCSGFVQMLFRQAGAKLPRDAQAQCDWEGFAAVEQASLAGGDVLFFGANLSEITHVGLYLGDGRFIHDTTRGSPGIQISVLENAPWIGLLVAQRRWKR